MKFPNIIFVTEQQEGNGDRYLIASKNLNEAMNDDDGPTLIAYYKLTHKRRIVKQLKEVPLRRKRGV